MNLQLLVPCVNKSEKEILDLCDFLRIASDAVFCNQCGQDMIVRLQRGPSAITVHNVSWRGVSKARNFLIDQCEADIGLFIDDDCVLNEGYETAVLRAFEETPEAIAIRFNTTREYWNPVHAEASHRRRASFKQLFGFGVWGFAFRAARFKSLNVRFNEKLGAPNYLFNGEDSAFLYDCCKKSRDIYQDSFFVCDVQETKKSTWFESYNEEYFVTKGFIYSYLYGSLWLLALARMYLAYKSSFKRKWREVLAAAKTGHRMFKEGRYEKPER